MAVNKRKHRVNSLTAFNLLLIYLSFFFSTGVAPMAPVAPGQREAAKLRTTPVEERIAAVII